FFWGLPRYEIPMLPFGAGLDPSKLDPKTLQKLTELIRELAPEQIQRMQTLMHNSMAGVDTRAGMEEFEKNLQPGFREKMARLMYEIHGLVKPEDSPSAPAAVAEAPATAPSSVEEARLTVLRGVASGSIPPEEALVVLFPEGN